VRQQENLSGEPFPQPEDNRNLEAPLPRRWGLLPDLTPAERVEIYKQVHRNARPRRDFLIMIALAAGIAGLGLRLNSPAVLIGAMLISPLMSAIVGLGLGAVRADRRLMSISGSALAQGILVAVAMGIVAAWAIPGTEPTAEIMARTEPSLLDLGVALISGLAGAYAICRRDASSALVGVAIAVALVPPLVTAGIGLAWLNWPIAGGAALLFITNLIAISAASELLFLILGFGPQLNRQSERSLFTGSLVMHSRSITISARQMKGSWYLRARNLVRVFSSA